MVELDEAEIIKMPPISSRELICISPERYHGIERIIKEMLRLLEDVVDADPYEPNPMYRIQEEIRKWMKRGQDNASD